MKKSELRKIIKEEIRKVLNDEDVEKRKNRFGGYSYHTTKEWGEYGEDHVATSYIEDGNEKYVIWTTDTPNTEELKEVSKEEFDAFISKFKIRNINEGLFDRFKKKSKPEPEELDDDTEESDNIIPSSDHVFGWYWPIADEAIEILKKDHPMVKLSAVGDGDEETYIGITASGFKGIYHRAEKRFKVYFDENDKVTNIEED